jgi:hypothetical protein
MSAVGAGSSQVCMWKRRQTGGKGGVCHTPRSNLVDGRGSCVLAAGCPGHQVLALRDAHFFSELRGSCGGLLPEGWTLPCALLPPQAGGPRGRRCPRGARQRSAPPIEPPRQPPSLPLHSAAGARQQQQQQQPAVPRRPGAGRRRRRQRSWRSLCRGGGGAPRRMPPLGAPGPPRSLCQPPGGAAPPPPARAPGAGASCDTSLASGAAAAPCRAASPRPPAWPGPAEHLPPLVLLRGELQRPACPGAWNAPPRYAARRALRALPCALLPPQAGGGRSRPAAQGARRPLRRQSSRPASL